MSKRTAATAEAGAAAPTADTADTADTTAPVHTSAQPANHPPDEFTGLGGDYVRDPVTGIRSRATPT